MIGMQKLLLFVAFVASFTGKAVAAPHIVVFLSDDHTLLDCSLYGSREIDTPNMARLAADGMTFNRAFVASPSCAPSRAALLTGLMPAHNGAEANHAQPRKEIKRLPAYFHDLGYEVVSFGKTAHYNQVKQYGFDIARHSNYHEDVAVGEAVKWLKQRDDQRPLCLIVGTNWPHVPWPELSTITVNDVRIPDKHVDTPKTRQARARYLQAIKTMDDELGAVYDAAVEKLGDDVLFVHTSDHGAQWPFSKWNLYDDGIRTPLVVRWKGRVAQGVRTDAMVSWVDILPTLIEAAGGAPPDALDGRSFLPVLSGTTNEHRAEIFTTHSGDGNYNVYPARSIRDGRYKYILNLHPEFRFQSHVTLVEKDGGYWKSWVRKAQTNADAAEKIRRYQQRPGEELYDLDTDPDERRNLADDPQHAERLTAMRARLAKWLEEMGDQRKVFGQPNLLSDEPGLPRAREKAAQN
ncbi:MAG: sulfatase [Planctomycetales bacterium]|nr:sulfatase [Planctomycetales bacterium]